MFYFADYRGMYFFGSRPQGTYTEESDFDIVVIFDELNFQKKMQLAGIIGDIEYEYNVIIDYKLLTAKGKRSIDYLRKYINPYFIQEAIDKGIFYGNAERNFDQKRFSEVRKSR